MEKKKIELEIDADQEKVLDEYCQAEGVNRKEGLEKMVKTSLDDWKDDKEFSKLIDEYLKPISKHQKKDE